MTSHDSPPGDPRRGAFFDALTRQRVDNSTARSSLARPLAPVRRRAERHSSDMVFFDDLGDALAKLIAPAEVGTTKITSKGPKDSPLDGADVTIDLDGGAKTLALDAARSFDLPIDGMKVTAKANHAGDVSADVEANGVVKGLDVAIEKLARDASNATVGAKYALDAIGITANGALGGGDIAASAAFAIDDDTAVGAKATVSPTTGGLAEWSLAAQRRDGPTTLSATVTDGGNTLTIGVVSDLDAKTKAGMETRLRTGGDKASLSYSLAVAKTLQSGNTMRVVYSSAGDYDVTYTTTLCEGATATGCLRLASKGHHYKTGFSVALGH